MRLRSLQAQSTAHDSRLHIENQLVLEGRDPGGDFLEPLLDRVVRERDDLVLQLPLRLENAFT